MADSNISGTARAALADLVDRWRADAEYFGKTLKAAMPNATMPRYTGRADQASLCAGELSDLLKRIDEGL